MRAGKTKMKKQGWPMKIAKAKQEKLESLVLAHGSHSSLEQGACVMEVVSWVAGEAFSDHPACASPVITKLAIRLNDRWSDEDRQALKPFILRIAGTAAPLEVERKRAFMCADWAVRVVLPLAMEAWGKQEWAEKLRALPAVVDKATAERARDVAHEARSAYAAYADAAAYAAYADAADAAAYAAYAAYADAAAYAAYADAADAAAYAAYADAAAYAAAYAADAQVRTKLKASALALLDRLCALTEKPPPAKKQPRAKPEVRR